MKRIDLFCKLISLFDIIKIFFKKIWDSCWFKICLIICIFLLLILNFYGLSIFKGTVDYNKFGTVGDWFSNFATLITIIVAAVTIINDKRIAENERAYNQSIREADQQERENQKLIQQNQLSKAVYVWISGSQDYITKEVGDYKLFISNKTGAPIFEWSVNIENKKNVVGSNDIGPLFPEMIKEISVHHLKPDSYISINFTSFDGKKWIRTGDNVKEETNG